jgi:phosphatidylserine decarboxylase
VTRIIILSPLDVHINRAPVAGGLTMCATKPASFSRPITKAARYNEQNALRIVDERERN